MDTATITTTINDPGKRHDFVLLFDVTDGNPNGDPDAGNLPRVDPETMQGLVTDVCLKRKVRDYVNLAKGAEEGYNIYVEHSGLLIPKHKRAYAALEEEGIAEKNKKKPLKENKEWTKLWMCKNFYDIRMFGAVMSLDINCGQVRGPVQLTFARSVDPVVPMDLCITRVAITDEKEQKRTSSQETDEGQTYHTMGRKALLPYGLYVGHGFFNASFAGQTGVGSADLELFWRALVNMFEQDRSAARGMMACRGLYVFTHDNPMGNAPAHKLFERIRPALKSGVEAPRTFSDYAVEIDDADLPDGVILTRVLE